MIYDEEKDLPAKV
jgi:P-type E1-E2 ATPase